MYREAPSQFLNLAAFEVLLTTWYEQEWYDYLTEKMGSDILEKYHPEALKEESPTLEGFFGL